MITKHHLLVLCLTLWWPTPTQGHDRSERQESMVPVVRKSSTTSTSFLPRLLERNQYLEEKYQLRLPTQSFSQRKLDLKFEVSDMIEETFVSYRVFDSHKCQDGDFEGDQGASDISSGTDYLQSRLRPDFQPVGSGENFRSMRVTVEIDPEAVMASPIYNSYSDTSGAAQFCVRFSVWNGDTQDASALEVNFLEIPVHLNMNLQSGFSIGTFDAVYNETRADENVEVFTCNTVMPNTVGVDPNGKNIGELVRICMAPTDEAMEQGLYIRYIDEFFFYRGEDLIQYAIRPGTRGAPADEVGVCVLIVSRYANNDFNSPPNSIPSAFLPPDSQRTIVDCPFGSDLCIIETLLDPNFFENIGGTSNDGESTRRALEEAQDEIGSGGRVLLQFGKDITPEFDEELVASQGSGTSGNSGLASNFALKITPVPKLDSGGPDPFIGDPRDKFIASAASHHRLACFFSCSLVLAATTASWVVALFL